MLFYLILWYCKLFLVFFSEPCVNEIIPVKYDTNNTMTINWDTVDSKECNNFVDHFKVSFNSSNNILKTELLYTTSITFSCQKSSQVSVTPVSKVLLENGTTINVTGSPSGRYVKCDNPAGAMCT